MTYLLALGQGTVGCTLGKRASSKRALPGPARQAESDLRLVVEMHGPIPTCIRTYIHTCIYTYVHICILMIKLSYQVMADLYHQQ